MTTKQHYKAIAEIVKKDGLDYELADMTAAPGSVWSNFAGKLADYFATDNPLFDRDKFMAACGLD